MLKFIAIALIIYSVQSQPPITPGPDITCRGHPANGFFADSKDKTIFYECAHGEVVGAFRCPEHTIFNDERQACDYNPDDHTGEHTTDPRCPQPDGLFKDPQNAHKFIECSKGYANEMVCPGSLIFDDSLKICVFNDNGVTWPSNAATAATVPITVPPVTSAPVTAPPATVPPVTAAPATVPPVTAAPATVPPVTAAPVTTVPVTSGPVGTSPAGSCTQKGFFKDPTNIHNYHVCKDGKTLTIPCPEDMVFSDEEKTCV